MAFRGSVVRVWDRRRLTVPARWAQQLQVVRVEPRAGLVLVVRPARDGLRLQRQRRLLIPDRLARLAGWRAGEYCEARLTGCGDCVVVTAHSAHAPARSDDLLRVVDAISQHAAACPLPPELLVDAALLRVL